MNIALHKTTLSPVRLVLEDSPIRNFLLFVNSANSECITQEVITFWDNWDKKDKITYCK
jgi:hypothetical protein